MDIHITLGFKISQVITQAKNQNKLKTPREQELMKNSKPTNGY